MFKHINNHNLVILNHLPVSERSRFDKLLYNLTSDRICIKCNIILNKYNREVLVSHNIISFNNSYISCEDYMIKKILE